MLELLIFHQTIWRLFQRLFYYSSVSIWRQRQESPDSIFCLTTFKSLLTWFCCEIHRGGRAGGSVGELRTIWAGFKENWRSRLEIRGSALSCSVYRHCRHSWNTSRMRSAYHPLLLFNENQPDWWKLSCLLQPVSRFHLNTTERIIEFLQFSKLSDFYFL